MIVLFARYVSIFDGIDMLSLFREQQALQEVMRVAAFRRGRGGRQPFRWLDDLPVRPVWWTWTRGAVG